MITKQFSDLIKSALAGLDLREQDVLKKRYGLEGNGMPLTLAAVGARYGVTRERIRQIEAFGIEKARSNTRSDQALVAFIHAAGELVSRTGGAEREEAFLGALRGATYPKATEGEFRNGAKFLLEISNKLFPFLEDAEFHAYWYRAAEDRRNVERFAGKLAAVIKNSRKELLGGNKQFPALAGALAEPFRATEEVALRWASLSKQFSRNVYGEWGLSVWGEANPKTARDWAYLVLRKERQPLHFTQIAATVRKFRRGKATNVQTVHNELIKDSRFMLVGRGIYGLSEFGILPGTAREVIAHFLKRHGPLKANDLTKFVLRERVFKPSTILINLQNKAYFKRLDDGRYTLLKEA